MNPYITIVIPCYHSDPELFRKCLESVRDQTYQNWMVVLAIDDYHPGNEEERIADEIIPFQYRRTISRDKTTPAAARNRALDLIHSPYVAFLDSDDWWTANHLELLADASIKNPTGAVFHTYSWRGCEDVIGGRAASWINLRYLNPVPWSSSMFKTETIKQYRFDPELKAGDDSDLIYRMRKENFVFIPEITCWQTFHPGRLSNKGRHSQSLAVRWGKHKNPFAVAGYCYYVLKMALKGRSEYL